MTMRLIGRLLDNWGSEVEKIANNQLPLGHSFLSNSSFPLQQLQQYTTQYVVNRKERAVAGLCDERLIKLVQKSNSKEIALAACAHLLSPQAVRTLIVRDFSRLDPVPYLQLILIAHNEIPNAVEQSDSDRAKALLHLYSIRSVLGSDGQFLRGLFNIIKKGVPKTSLIYSTLYTEVLSTVPIVSAALGQLRIKHQWHQAWKMISWISNISSNEAHLIGECLDPIELLDRNFRAWRMWAAWRPVESRISMDFCNDEQRAKLHEYLALEGPDDQVEPQANLCERILARGLVIENSLARIGNTTFARNIAFKLETGTQEEARALLTRMCRVLGQAIHFGPSSVDLFIELYWEKEITAQSLDVMDAVVVATAAHFGVTNQVLRLYTFVRKNSWDKYYAARDLLRALRQPDCQQLRKSATGKLAANILVEQIKDLQAKLLISWEADTRLTSTTRLEVDLLTLVSDIRKDSVAELQLSDLVDAPFFELLAFWPSRAHLAAIHDLRKWVQAGGITGTSVRTVDAKVSLYLRDVLIERGAVDQDTRDMVQALTKFGTNPLPSLEHQHLAIFLAGGPGKFRTTCILNMTILSHKEVTELAQLMREWLLPETWEIACVKLARFLAGNTGQHAEEIVETWKPVLYRMFKAKGVRLVAQVATWPPIQNVQFFSDIKRIFEDSIWNPKLSPPILDPSLQNWGNQLSTYLPMLTTMQSDPQWSSALKFFVNGNDRWALEGILCHFRLQSGWTKDNNMRELSFCVASCLSDNNAQEVYEVLCSVSMTSGGGTCSCIRLIDLCRGGEPMVASVLLASWLQDPTWDENDTIGFKDLARLLHITPADPADITIETLEAVTSYLETNYIKLFEVAQRFDAMRVELKKIDYEGVSQLLYDNHIEDTTPMEDSLATLPVELLNVVEEVDESEVEIIFPLTDITPLHRAAMGIGNAQSLLIRLNNRDYGSVSTRSPIIARFCIHLDNEPKLDSHDIHSQWTVFSNGKAPELPICHGTVTPATYQLARVLSRFLVKTSPDLLSIHTFVTRVIQTMGHECLICGSLHGTDLRRPTTCNGWECLHIFSQSPIEIRLGDIRTDPLAVDMILTMIHSSIISGFHNLLPNCPFDQKTCLAILKEMPAMEDIQKSKTLWYAIRGWQDGKSEQFLTWAICSFRGFLSTATGNLRIPSLPPGTLQFVLANAAPVKELAFASEFRTNAQQSRVMFHGTTLDRLYLIMHQGLKIMSGTPLQAYGAAYGNGIYLSEDPGKSWAYAKAPKSKLNWAGSAIKNERVLLGCELTGPVMPPAAAGIHVVPTEACVMVRYIFVVPSATVNLPINGHIAPAMMSVFNSLRSRAL